MYYHPQKGHQRLLPAFIPLSLLLSRFDLVNFFPRGIKDLYDFIKKHHTSIYPLLRYKYIHSLSLNKIAYFKNAEFCSFFRHVISLKDAFCL